MEEMLGEEKYGQSTIFKVDGCVLPKGTVSRLIMSLLFIFRVTWVDLLRK